MSGKKVNFIISDYSAEPAGSFNTEDHPAHEVDNAIHTMKFFWSFSGSALSTFDASTSNLNKVSLKTEQWLDQYGAKCILPNGSLFYDNVPMTIIIDLEYHVRRIPSYSGQSLNACAVYKDGEVYLLGGTYNNSAKFKISENRWSPIANLPTSLGSYTYSAIFKQYILLGSMSTHKILYYDTIIDSYSEILLACLKRISSKAFFVVDETVYLFDFSQCIYKSVDNLLNWNNIGDCSMLAGNAPIISTPLIYNQKVYFANYYGIYIFELKNEKVQKLIDLCIDDFIK